MTFQIFRVEQQNRSKIIISQTDERFVDSKLSSKASLNFRQMTEENYKTIHNVNRQNSKLEGDILESLFATKSKELQ